MLTLSSTYFAQLYNVLDCAFPEATWRLELLDGDGFFRSGHCYIEFCSRLVKALRNLNGYGGDYGSVHIDFGHLPLIPHQPLVSSSAILHRKKTSKSHAPQPASFRLLGWSHPMCSSKSQCRCQRLHVSLRPVV